MRTRDHPRDCGGAARRKALAGAGCAREADRDSNEHVPNAHASPGQCVLVRGAPRDPALSDVEGLRAVANGAAAVGVDVEAGTVGVPVRARGAKLIRIRRREPDIEAAPARKQSWCLAPCVPRVVVPAVWGASGHVCKLPRDGFRNFPLGGTRHKRCVRAGGRSERYGDDRHDSNGTHLLRTLLVKEFNVGRGSLHPRPARRMFAA